MKTQEKLSALRSLMLKKGIDAWIIPSGDPHQSEYVAEHWKARAWFSGFTGSAGVCVVTRDKAGLWTDSRYWIQAARQLKDSGIEFFKASQPGVPTYKAWLAQELPENATIGFDGSLLSVASVTLINRELSYKKINLKYNEDLVSEIWSDRPPIPRGKVSLLSEEYSGESTRSKIERVRKEIAKLRCDYHVISALDEIAWLFNIRGTDISYNPVVISYAFLSQDDACLFIDESKLDLEVKVKLEASGVKFFPYDNIFEFLSLMPENKRLLLDPTKVSLKIKESVNCQTLTSKSIITRLKSVKNEIEQQGFRDSHVQDGIAMVRFFHWLQENVGKLELDEYTLAEKLLSFRKQGKLFQGESFNPIIGYKSNGAIVHYSAQQETASEIHAEGLLLLDSGGQYLNGTTDITRTVSLGNPTEEEKRHFTIVLSAHINLAMAKFPKNSTGITVDTFTRIPIWKEEMSYGHGTGHGVGHYLCVHEGPQSISSGGLSPMLIGSVTTNEPGIYLEGKFGIRIENIMICQQVSEGGYGVFCGFETVTRCPIDRSLIDTSMLDDNMLSWLNEYHQLVYNDLSAHLDESDRHWLKSQTAPLSR